MLSPRRCCRAANSIILRATLLFCLSLFFCLQQQQWLAFADAAYAAPGTFTGNWKSVAGSGRLNTNQVGAIATETAFSSAAMASVSPSGKLYHTLWTGKPIVQIDLSTGISINWVTTGVSQGSGNGGFTWIGSKGYLCTQSVSNGIYRIDESVQGEFVQAFGGGVGTNVDSAAGAPTFKTCYGLVSDGSDILWYLQTDGLLRKVVVSTGIVTTAYNPGSSIFSCISASAYHNGLLYYGSGTSIKTIDLSNPTATPGNFNYMGVCGSGMVFDTNGDMYYLTSKQVWKTPFTNPGWGIPVPWAGDDRVGTVTIPQAGTGAGTAGAKFPTARTLSISGLYLYFTDQNTRVIFRCTLSSAFCEPYAGQGARFLMGAAITATFPAGAGFHYGSWFWWMGSGVGLRIHKATFIVEHIAGAGWNGYLVEADSGTGTSAIFGVHTLKVVSNIVRFVDSANGFQKIRQMSLVAPYAITSIAGSTSGAALDDASGANAVFFQIQWCAEIAAPSTGGYIFVHDYRQVRKVSLTTPYAVSTVLGDGTPDDVTADGTGTNPGTQVGMNVAMTFSADDTVVYMCIMTGNQFTGTAVLKKFTASTYVMTTVNGGFSGRAMTMQVYQADTDYLLYTEYASNVLPLKKWGPLSSAGGSQSATALWGATGVGGFAQAGSIWSTTGFGNVVLITFCTSASGCNNHASSASGIEASCTCTCSTGFSGSTCDACATNYGNPSYPTCDPTPCSFAVSCNSHASSVSGTDMVSGCTCTCSTGFTGATCNQCAINYGNPAYPACDPTPCTIAADCNNHASAVSGTLVSGCTCTCTYNFAGSSCNSCANRFAKYPVCRTDTASMSFSTSASPSTSHTQSTSYTTSLSVTKSQTVTDSAHLLQVNEYRVSTVANVLSPQQVAVDTSNNALICVIVAQGAQHTISNVTVDGSGSVALLAGTPGTPGATDVLDNIPSGGALFRNPIGVAFDHCRLVTYVADTLNHVIRVIEPPLATNVKRMAGQFGVQGSTDSADPLLASMNTPFHLAITADCAALYWTETQNFIIRKQTIPNGAVSLLAGVVGLQGHADSAPGQFFDPKGIAVDIDGNLLIVDSASSSLRKVTSAGIVSTVAGGTSGAHRFGFKDGTFAEAEFANPIGVCSSPSTDAIVVDQHNFIVRHIDFATNVVQRLAGNPLHNHSIDGPALQASFGRIHGCAHGAPYHRGGYYISDPSHHKLRALMPETPTATESLIQPRFQADQLRVLLNTTHYHSSMFKKNNETLFVTAPLHKFAIPIMGLMDNRSDVDNYNMLVAQDGISAKIEYLSSPVPKTTSHVYCFDGYPCDLFVDVSAVGFYHLKINLKFLQDIPVEPLEVFIRSELPGGDFPSNFALQVPSDPHVNGGSVLEVSGQLLGTTNGTLAIPFYSGSVAEARIRCYPSRKIVSVMNQSLFENKVRYAINMPTYDRANCRSLFLEATLYAIEQNGDYRIFTARHHSKSLCPMVAKLVPAPLHNTTVVALPQKRFEIQLAPDGGIHLSFPYLRPHFVTGLPHCVLGAIQTVASTFSDCQLHCRFTPSPGSLSFADQPLSLTYPAARSDTGVDVTLLIGTVTVIGNPTSLEIMNEGPSEFQVPKHGQLVLIKHCFVVKPKDAGGSPTAFPSQSTTLTAFHTQHLWDTASATFRVCNVTIIPFQTKIVANFTVGALTITHTLFFYVSPYCTPPTPLFVTGCPLHPGSDNLLCSSHNLSLQTDFGDSSAPLDAKFAQLGLQFCETLSVGGPTGNIFNFTNCTAPPSPDRNNNDLSFLIGFVDGRLWKFQDTVSLESTQPPIGVHGFQGVNVMNVYPSIGYALQGDKVALQVEAFGLPFLVAQIAASFETGISSQTELRVYGYGFTSTVVASFVFADWPEAFPLLTHFVSNTELRVFQPIGFGTGGRLKLTNNSTGKVVLLDNSSKATFNFVEKNERFCGRDPQGLLCGGHGACDPDDGRCVCYGDGGQGYWGEKACTSCLVSHNASTDCKIPCPADPDGVVCSARGTCAEGNCTCSAGFVGDACQVACPGEPFCTGNGICSFATEKCECYDNDAQGHWQDAACSTCVEGWSGSNCTIECPRNSSDFICSGRGVCLEGVCACRSGWCGELCTIYDPENCLDCPLPGLFGPSCDKACPGSFLVPCFGHGTCNNGRQGDGACYCDYGYAGDDCTKVCPGGATNPCTGHGLCKPFGNCICAALFASADCSVACPRGVGNLTCSGRGSCNDGAQGDGQCNCFKGYTSSDCSVECPGGAVSPCNNNGKCQSNGTCSCNFNAKDGYWVGVACSECAPDWYGFKCNGQCPKAASGKQCNARGKCRLDLVCMCHKDLTRGFWVGDDCGECLYGFYGAECTSECPGGGCTPCIDQSQGICDSGTSGSGVCTCKQDSVTGYWKGAACTECTYGFWGNRCNKKCRGFVLPGRVCSGHGVCSSSVVGDGECTCNPHFLKDEDHSCTICETNYFGSNCEACGFLPWLKETIPCSGHGTCNDGFSGTGVCSCDVGYSGSRCERCALGWTSNSSSSLCNLCAPRFYGSDCSNYCPLCAFHFGATCDDGLTGTGTCQCAKGYWGTSCDQACPGGVETPCSDHGMCNTATGQCECFMDNVNGYWTGTECTACDPHHLSDGCLQQCPIGAENALVCSGRGACFNANCTGCAPKDGDRSLYWCGTDCSQKNAQCVSNAYGCALGFWGLDCTFICPGSTPEDQSGTCSGRGSCSSMDGFCYCEFGYWGTNCENECAKTAAGLFCNEKGYCSTTGRCMCDHGYWGPVCALECPGGAASPCSNGGNCSIDTGLCTCDYGRGGDDCSRSCGIVNGFICNAGGDCDPVEARCYCYADPLKGFYDGDNCERCTRLYSGGKCNVQCDSVGTRAVSGIRCSCHVGYAGLQCSTQCPGYQAVSICNTHGQCSDGNFGDGTCTCDAEWYDAGCTTHCSVDRCKQEENLVNPMCNITSGECICEHTTTGSKYSGPTCDDCVLFYWGEKCNIPCPCNRHGGCDRLSGQCNCFNDDINGYWMGQECTVCLTGYIGVDCRSKNIEISSNTALTARTSIADTSNITSSVLLNDKEFSLMYVGSQPIVVFNTTANPPSFLAQFSLPDNTRVLTARILNKKSLRFSAQSFDEVALGSSREVLHYDLTRGITVRISSSVSLVKSSSTSRKSQVLETLSFNASTTAPINASSTAAAVQLSVTSTASSDIVASLLTDGTFFIITNAFQVDFSIADVMILLNLTEISNIRSLPLLPESAAKNLHRFLFSGRANVTWGVTDCTFIIDDVKKTVSINTTSTKRFSAWTESSGVSSELQRASGCMADPRNTTRLLCVFFHPLNGLYLGAIQPNRPSLFVHITIESWPVVHYVSSMTSDTFSSIPLGIVAVHTDSQRSQIFKFNLDTCELTGILSLSQVGVNYEVVRGLEVDPQLRILYATITAGSNVEVRSLNLFGVKSVYPEVVDGEGGAVITISGEGFSPFATPECRFSTDPLDASPGIFVNDQTLKCETLPGRASEQCKVLNINVAFGERGTAVTNTPLKRPSTPTIRGTLTSEGIAAYSFFISPVSITLVGTGFLPANLPACRILKGTQTQLELQFERYINSSAVVCTAPPLTRPTQPPSFIVYAHDSHVFSLPIPYRVVGDTKGVRVQNVLDFSPPSNHILRSQYVKPVPTIVVKAVDEYSNFVENYEKRFHEVTASVRNENDNGRVLTTIANASSAQRNMILGQVVFEQISLLTPLEGRILLVFSMGPGFTDAALPLTIVPGVPAKLQLEEFNAAYKVPVKNSGYLRAELVIADIAGNAITNPKSFGIFDIEAKYSVFEEQDLRERETGVTILAAFDGHIAKFSDIAVTTSYGRSIDIRFSVPNHAGIPPIIAPALLSEKCDVPFREYYIQFEFFCRPCPPHGSCVGTSEVEVDTGYWRGSQTSYSFYSCKKPFSDDSCLKGQCKAGYEGPRCSVCSPGYGKSGLACTRCPTPAEIWVYAAIAVLAAAGGLFLLVTSSINSGQTASAKGKALPIVLKMLISHFQILGICGNIVENMPPFLSIYFRGQASVSITNIQFSFVACGFAPTYIDMFYTVLLLPVICIAIMIVPSLLKAIFGVWNRRRRREIIQYLEPVDAEELARYRSVVLGEYDDMDHEEYDIVAVCTEKAKMGAHDSHDGSIDAQNDTRDATGVSAINDFVRIFAVVFVITVMLFYPAIIEACTKMLECEDIVYSRIEVKSVMMHQRDVECSSAYYAKHRASALIALGLYGIGTPLSVVAVVKLVQYLLMGGDGSMAKRFFFFTTGCLKESFWFWESFALLRKATMIVISTAITSEDYRTLTTMYAANFFLAVNIYSDPWENQNVGRVENQSLLTIAISLNLILLLPMTDGYESHTWYLISYSILAANILMLVVFAVALFSAAKEKLGEMAQKHPEYLSWLLESKSKEIIAMQKKTIHAYQGVKIDSRKALKAAHQRTGTLHAFLLDEAFKQLKSSSPSSSEETPKAFSDLNEKLERYLFFLKFTSHQIDVNNDDEASYSKQRSNMSYVALLFQAEHELLLSILQHERVKNKTKQKKTKLGVYSP